jgi:hypothetical protein
MQILSCPLCLTKHHAMKTYWESGGIAPRILDLGTRWRWVVRKYVGLYFLQLWNFGNCYYCDNVHKPEDYIKHKTVIGLVHIIRNVLLV